MSDIEEYATEYPFDTGYQWIEQIKAENAALRARVAELETVLQMVEYEDYEGDEFCCWCRNYKWDGHEPDCPRQKVLAA